MRDTARPTSYKADQHFESLTGSSSSEASPFPAAVAAKQKGGTLRRGRLSTALSLFGLAMTVVFSCQALRRLSRRS